MKSYNGWYASPNLNTVVIEPVPGFRVRVVNNANVIAVFTYLVQQYHARVDNVLGPHKADDWGFYFRKNRNSNNLSNHASGTAIDIDATEHPNGVRVSKTFTDAEVSEIREILDELDDVIDWGGDYKRTVDGMHFELGVPPGKLQEIGKKIRQNNYKRLGVKPTTNTRVQNFRRGGPQWNVNILDRAAAQRADVARVVHRINVAVNKLPRDKASDSLVNQFVDTYKKHRLLRMGLLTAAVRNGRTGTVKDVLDEIRHQIHTELPDS